MKTVIVAKAHARRGQGGGGLNPAKLGGAERPGLLHQHMLAGLHGGERDGCERGVQGRNDDGVDGGVLQRDRVVSDRPAAGRSLREAGRAGGIQITGVAKPPLGIQGGGALPADQAAADLGELQLR